MALGTTAPSATAAGSAAHAIGSMAATAATASVTLELIGLIFRLRHESLAMAQSLSVVAVTRHQFPNESRGVIDVLERGHDRRGIHRDSAGP